MGYYTMIITTRSLLVSDSLFLFSLHFLSLFSGIFFSFFPLSSFFISFIFPFSLFFLFSSSLFLLFPSSKSLIPHLVFIYCTCLLFLFLGAFRCMVRYFLYIFARKRWVDFMTRGVLSVNRQVGKVDMVLHNCFGNTY